MKDLLKRFGMFLLQGLIGLAFLVFFLIIFMEWMAGCGETYIDSKGRRHQHECIFINHPPKEKK